MKTKMIAGTVLAVGMLSFGALSASAAGSCCNGGKCTDKPTVQLFLKETEELNSALKAKSTELREQFTYDTVDARRVQALEEEVKELKGRIGVVGAKYDIPPCCRG